LSAQSEVPLVFVSARVHAGEVPSSFVMEGFLRFITSQDERALTLRKAFVFIFVPMINIDGVILGYQRSNAKGVNLNRVYGNPSLEEHPVIFAIKQVILQYADRLTYYFDLHAHARSRGCFFYGNSYKDEEKLRRSLLFVKLAELNHPALQFAKRDFRQRIMASLDKNGESRSGSGRVQAWEMTKRNLVHSYTIECNYHSTFPYETMRIIYFTPEIFMDVGKALALTILDIDEMNPEPAFDQRKRKIAEHAVNSIMQKKFSHSKREKVHV